MRKKWITALQENKSANKRLVIRLETVVKEMSTSESRQSADWSRRVYPPADAGAADGMP